MDFNTVKERLIEQGKNPDDFNINVTENGYSVTPKWYWEQLEKARNEDKPIIQSVDVSMMAMVDVYEDNLRLEQENTTTMMALTDLYEMMLGG